MVMCWPEAKYLSLIWAYAGVCACAHAYACMAVMWWNVFAISIYPTRLRLTTYLPGVCHPGHWVSSPDASIPSSM